MMGRSRDTDTDTDMFVFEDVRLEEVNTNERDDTSFFTGPKEDSTKELSNELKRCGKRAFMGVSAWTSGIIVLVWLLVQTQRTISNNSKGLLLGVDLTTEQITGISTQLMVITGLVAAIGLAGLAYMINELNAENKGHKRSYKIGKWAIVSLLVIGPALAVCLGLYGLKYGLAMFCGPATIFCVAVGALIGLGFMAFLGLVSLMTKKHRREKEYRPAVWKLLLPFLMFLALAGVLIWAYILLSSSGISYKMIFDATNGIGSTVYVPPQAPALPKPEPKPELPKPKPKPKEKSLWDIFLESAGRGGGSGLSYGNWM
ncbi:hypothetical protein NEHOM01_0052 [Nematocida homosporus]|uniref:uncharacterized protein n=1 Tax=Nematocida homosporus TaxID=1912981 RepID=UPI0022201053|nr:uncharacterized protein NEHOM01_0052 [Nematocida homosporus]KAI5184307.1 hypothetical protein NEHOM01_0052 [Nematocida homosporus]